MPVKESPFNFTELKVAEMGNHNYADTQPFKYAESDPLTSAESDPLSSAELYTRVFNYSNCTWPSHLIRHRITGRRAD